MGFGVGLGGRFCRYKEVPVSLVNPLYLAAVLRSANRELRLVGNLRKLRYDDENALIKKIRLDM